MTVRRAGCPAWASARPEGTAPGPTPSGLDPVGDCRVGCMGRRSPGRRGGRLVGAPGRGRWKIGCPGTGRPGAGRMVAPARRSGSACRRGWPQGRLIYRTRPGLRNDHSRRRRCRRCRRTGRAGRAAMVGGGPEALAAAAALPTALGCWPKRRRAGGGTDGRGAAGGAGAAD